MEKTVKKLYQGRLVDLRDFDVQKCIEDGENMKVRYDGDIMTLSPVELKAKRKNVSSIKFKSKTGGADYHLYSYEWTPDEMDY